MCAVSQTLYCLGLAGRNAVAMRAIHATIKKKSHKGSFIFYSLQFTLTQMQKKRKGRNNSLHMVYVFLRSYRKKNLRKNMTYLSTQVLNDSKWGIDGAVYEGWRRRECSEALVDVTRVLPVQHEPGYSHQSLEVILVKGRRAIDEAEYVTKPSRRVRCQATG